MINFKPYSSVNESEVLALLEPLWGNMDMPTRKSYFQWKYINNPATDDVLAFVAIDTTKGKVIGFRGFFPTRYMLNWKIVFVASFSDVVIHPDYRKQGLFERITRYGITYLENNKSLAYYYSTSSAWPTSKGYIKIGSVPLASKKDMYRVCLLPAYKKSKKFRLEFSQDCYASDISSIHERTQNKNILTIQKDEAFIKWRYQNPVTKYYFVYAWQDNQLAGYISYYKISDNRCYIFDYNVQDYQVLDLLVKHLAAHSKCRLIQVWSISNTDKEAKLWKKAGFRYFKRLFRILGKKELPPILIRPAVIDYSESDFYVDGKDVRNEYNWDINLICSDGV
jgi:GNAT superfamily N-acetyltransferase